MTGDELAAAGIGLTVLSALSLGVRALFATAVRRTQPDAAEYITRPLQTTGARQAAFAALLDQPDPPEMQQKHPRGHRLTVKGKANRHETTWLPASRAWVVRRLDQSTGALEGWRFAHGRRRMRWADLSRDPRRA